METWQGKHFSITDPEGVNTVIYQINKTPKDLTKEYPKYTVDRLDYTEELRGNMKRKTFYVDFPTYEDELLILSFAKDKVVVNTAIMADDKIKAEEINALGEGGLCLNCPVCTFPNCGFGK